MVEIVFIGGNGREDKGLYQGACFGVRDAVADTDRELAEGSGRVVSINKIAHNPDINERLADKGLGVVSRVEDVKAGDTVVAGAYGLEQSVIDGIEKRGARIVSTTCPIVENAHRKAAAFVEKGYKVFVYGMPQHPEVKTAVEKYGAVCVQSLDELTSEVKERGLHDKKIALVSQTTMNLFRYNTFVQNALRLYPDIKFADTLCGVVKKRQQHLADILAEIDLVVIVGGRDSSNTKRLGEIAGSKGIYVERTAELLEYCDKVRSATEIGIASGTSTPLDVVYEVRDRIEELCG